MYDSRLNTQSLVRRRRSCRECGFRFATIEILNAFQPLGKKEKANAPVPEAPPPKQKQAKVKSTVRPTSNRSIGSPDWGEPVVPWNDDDDDFRDYFDLPRSFENE